MLKNPRIIFFGTPEFSAITLEGLIKGGYKPILVVCAPDKPVGRKKIITPPPAKKIAEKNKIKVIQPENLKEIESKFLLSLKPDLGISSAYGKIIPKKILDIPKKGFLNLHPSLLPKYRGPSPIQTAILNGDKETGATIMLMDKKIDHGPILAQKKIKIKPNIIYKELEKELAEIGSNLLLKTIPKWLEGKIKPKPQNEKKATYTKIIKKEDGKIDWNKSAKKIEQKIRAFSSWPGAFAFFKKNSKILKAEILEAETSNKEVPNCLCIKCGKDYLLIKKIKPQGKNPMGGKDFINGYGKVILF